MGTGDCCRMVKGVTMTWAERREIEAVTDRSLRWEAGERPSLTILRARPCPLLGDDGRCTVYEVRPYSCRRWGCGRTERSQRVEDAPVPLLVRQSAELLEDARRMQTAAQPWALAHGWKPEWR
jgi:Fe-S-cluster containining protein